MKTRRISGGRNATARGPVARGGPTLSLVVAVRELGPAFEAAIGALVSPCLRSNVELVIACSAPRRSLDALRRRHPGVRFTALESSSMLPELRAAGMREATGEVIVLLDDAATPRGATRAASLLVACIEQAGTAQAADARPVPWGPLLGRLMATHAASSDPAVDALAGGAPRGLPAASHAAGD